KIQPDLVVLKNGNNKFTYIVTKKDGTIVDNAKASFLLTQPHSTREDKMIESVPFSKGYYIISNIKISKAGRYTLKFRAKVGDFTSYFSLGAYLKP
ncbi:MAG: hypothetical protein JJV88_03410, partial [Sulfurovum sp.]|nr:hypothetical protein [Sulfurovaceae bacterium]